MTIPKIAVFSGPNATIANSPPLVTSNKGRLPGERQIPGKFDVLVPQVLYEPVTVKIKKFSAHPLEEDSADIYHDNGREYFEVTLYPEDGTYLLPYMARRKTDGSKDGTPFEADDMWNPQIIFGGRQFFYPDASRLFEEIDRTILGRSPEGESNMLNRRAEYDFIRVLPPAGYTKRGEVAGVDYFPYRPEPISRIVRVGDLAKIANDVQETLSSGNYAGGIWLDGSPQLEESLYWLNLIVDTNLPIAGVAAQRPHGELSCDGDRNIVDAVGYILSGHGDLGAVGVQDQVIYASREFKKGDARPGNYKATGGHGGILGSVKAGVTIWYKPNYNHTSSSEVNISKIPEEVEFLDSVDGDNVARVRIKDSKGKLLPRSIPHVHIVKYGSYSQDDESENPHHEVDIAARILKAQSEQRDESAGSPKLHGLVFEGLSPYAVGSKSQLFALWIAALSGIPAVRVGRSDPGGRVITDPNDLTIEGSNLDATKARLLLIASMLKLGRLPKAKDPRNPSSKERSAVVEKVAEFQKIFETH